MGGPDHVSQKGAREPASLVILLNKEGEFRTSRRSGGVHDNVAGPADDHLLLPGDDRDEQRDGMVKVRPDNPAKFSVTDVGLVPKEPSVDGIPIKIMERTADPGPVIGPGSPHSDGCTVPKNFL